MSTASLKEYAYVVPFESLATFRTAQRYTKRHNYSVTDIAYVCIRPELLLTVQKIDPHATIIDLADVAHSQTQQAAANQRLITMGRAVTEFSRGSDFIWSILIAWHSHYCLQATQAAAMAQAIVEAMNSTATLITWYPDVMWGSANDRINVQNPLLWLALQDVAEEKKIAFVIPDGSVGWATLKVFVWQHVRFWFNGVVNILVWFINGVIGIGRTFGPSRDDWAWSHDAAPYRTHATMLVTHENLRLKDSATWLSSGYSLAKKLWRIIWPAGDQLRIGRIDTRSPAARWLTMSLVPIPPQHWFMLERIWQASKRGQQQLRRQLPTLDPITFKHRRLRQYTEQVIKNYHWEFISEAWFVASLVTTVKPRTFLYPDGYSILIRLLQRQTGVKLIQVPHGHGNHHFPEYYYQADQYIAANRFIERHFLRHGVPGSKIIRWAETKPEPMVSVTNQSPKTIGIFYSGTYGYWAFPSFYQELHVITVELLTYIWEQWPDMTVILKSHPNGTNDIFFTNILNLFPDKVADQQLQLIGKGWASSEQYKVIDIAVAPLVVPSSPLLLLLRLGIPLLILAPNWLRDQRTMYGPFYDHVIDYPYLLHTMAEVQTTMANLISNPAELTRAKLTAYYYSYDQSFSGN